MWCSSKDFTYTVDKLSKITISSDEIKAVDRGVVTVTATHKVTNRVYKFKVYINNSHIEESKHDEILSEFQKLDGYGDAAAEYGDICYEYYKIFAKYNE